MEEWFPIPGRNRRGLMCVGTRDTLCRFPGSPDAVGRKTSLARGSSKWFPNGPGRSLGLFLFLSDPSLLKQVASLKRMNRLNPPFSRTHRALLVARIVFLTALAAVMAFVAARGNFTSKASRK